MISVQNNLITAFPQTHNFRNYTDKKFNCADYVKYSIIVMIFASIVFKYTNRIKNIRSIKRGLNALIAVKEVTYHVINNRVKN